MKSDAFNFNEYWVIQLGMIKYLIRRNTDIVNTNDIMLNKKKTKDYM